MVAALVEDAVRLLFPEENGKSRTIKVTLADEEGTSITIVFGQETIISVPDPQLRSKIFGEFENSIVRLLQESQKPLRGKEIAARIGERFTSHFRQMLAGLCKRQIIFRTLQGYSVHPKIKHPS
jgi:hypothetical protein